MSLLITSMVIIIVAIIMMVTVKPSIKNQRIQDLCDIIAEVTKAVLLLIVPRVMLLLCTLIIIIALFKAIL